MATINITATNLNNKSYTICVPNGAKNFELLEVSGLTGFANNIPCELRVCKSSESPNATSNFSSTYSNNNLIITCLTQESGTYKIIKYHAASGNIYQTITFTLTFNTKTSATVS